MLALLAAVLLGQSVNIADPSTASRKAKVTATSGGALQVECVGGTCSGGGGAGAAQTWVIVDGGFVGLWDGTDTADITAAHRLLVDGSGVTQPVSGTFWQATQPVSGTLTCNAGSGTLAVSGPLTDAQLRASAVPVSLSSTTCNAGTNLNTSALALDATLTGGSQKAIARGGAKGATAAADVTSTANGADHQGLDVQVQNASLAVTGTFWQATQPVSGTVTTTPPSNASTNVAQFGGSAVATGTGTGGVGVPRVTVSSDSSLTCNAGTGTLAVSITAGNFPDNEPFNLAQLGGNTISTGVGASGTGTQRNACLIHDGTTTAGVIAGTTALKTDLSSVAGTAAAAGYGVSSAGVQRVRPTQEATYSAGTTAKTATAAGTGPWFTICGSGTKTLRVQRFWAVATVATAAVYADIVLKKTSTATSAGTATALTKAPHDSNSAAATANAVNYYTVLATAGTSVGVVCGNMIFSPITGTVANFTHPSIVCDWTGKDESEAIVLRGTAQCLEASFGTTTTNAPTIHLHVQWTES